jgi:hypothetical protein
MQRLAPERAEVHVVQHAARRIWRLAALAAVAGGAMQRAQQAAIWGGFAVFAIRVRERARARRGR